MRIPPPAPVTISETYDILPSVLLRVSELGAMAWRQNSGSFRTPGGGFVRCAIPGCADILGLISLSVPHLHSLGIERIGAFVSLETKTLRGKPEDSQLEFRAGVLSRDGIYAIARSPEDVDRAFGKLIK